MIPAILKLDVTGSPSAWIQWHDAAALYARGRVRWEAGDEIYAIRGGRSANGLRTELIINSIIATDEQRNKLRTKRGPSNNRELFHRDRVCLYCGGKFSYSQLTADHILPASRGGDRSWTNLATACRDCNAFKADRLPEEAGMKLLALPYQPDPAAQLLLMASGRKITACQQQWLEASAKKGSRFN